MRIIKASDCFIYRYVEEEAQIIGKNRPNNLSCVTLT